MTPLLPHPDLAALRDLAAGWISDQVGAAELDLRPLAGGANNQVFHVHTPKRDLVLKRYFSHPADPRDRFAAERAFYSLIWEQGVRHTPEPVAWDERRRLGLLEFVPGRKLLPTEITRPAVEQALAFATEINELRAATEARMVPDASEACFSIAEHLECVESRVARLRGIRDNTLLDREAAAFAREEVMRVWARVCEGVVAACEGGTWGMEQTLTPDERCLSPSDFGFHNALMAPDGKLRFFDFEYAGWDDPAKLICDLFCQPQLPVDRAHWDFFAGGVAQWNGVGEDVGARACQLLPVYQVKWCCIVLNEFLRSEELRRDFAQGTALSRKEAQLEKARRILAGIS